MCLFSGCNCDRNLELSSNNKSKNIIWTVGGKRYNTMAKPLVEDGCKKGHVTLWKAGHGVNGVKKRLKGRCRHHLCDLNPLHLSVWSTLKAHTYSTPSRIRLTLVKKLEETWPKNIAVDYLKDHDFLYDLA